MKHEPENKNIRLGDYNRLVEKNKELTCLYAITQIILEADRPLDDILQAIADLLGPALQFPDRSTAHICLDQFSYQTPRFELCRQKLSEKVIVQGKERGCVEVGYLASDKTGPSRKQVFLAKEKQLLKKVARQLAFKIEKKSSRISSCMPIVWPPSVNSLPALPTN